MTDSDIARDELVQAGAVVASYVVRLETARVRLRAAVVVAAAAGISEVQIGKLAGISRFAVRAYLGKHP